MNPRLWFLVEEGHVSRHRMDNMFHIFGTHAGELHKMHAVCSLSNGSRAHVSQHLTKPRRSLSLLCYTKTANSVGSMPVADSLGIDFSQLTDQEERIIQVDS